ncbi:MAG: hypothetical protein IT210_19080 [Armatimonadetes bacterium]|nr:hypothetical protein [Armatimonadota bacterium]
MALTLDDYLEAAMWLGRRCEERAGEDFVCTYSKHQVSDLTPGLSDWDTRLILRNGVTAERWREVYPASVEAYLEMLRVRPQWARLLEHPPGYVFTPSETRVFLQHNQEALCWEMLWGAEPAERIRPLPEEARRAHRLSLLSTFLGYYRPDDPSTDPPINLDPAYLPRYPLYSSAAHYFMPMLRAVMGLLNGDAGYAKKQGIAVAMERLGDHPVLTAIQDAIAQGYDAPDLLDENRLESLRNGMFDLACLLFQELRNSKAVWPKQGDPRKAEAVALPDADAGSLPAGILGELHSVVLSPAMLGEGLTLYAVLRNSLSCNRRREISRNLEPLAEAAGAGVAPLLSAEEMAFAFPFARPVERALMASGITLWGAPAEEWLPWPSEEVLRETALRTMALSPASVRVRPPLLDYMTRTPDWFEARWLLETQVYAHMHSESLLAWLNARSILDSGVVPLSVEEAFQSVGTLRKSEPDRRLFRNLLLKTAPGQPVDRQSLQAIAPLWNRLEDMVEAWWAGDFG